jgi:hypothetical protein
LELLHLEDAKFQAEGVSMKNKLFIIIFVFLFTTTMIVACTSADKEPAELAIKSAELTVNFARAEIGKVAPEEVAVLENSLTSAKDKLGKGEYKAALAEAHALINKTKDAISSVKAKAEAAKAKIAELNKKWAELNDNLPKMIDTLQAKIDKLSKIKKLPAKISSEQFAEAKAAFTTMKEDWIKIQQNFKEGKIEEAVSSATSAQERLVKVMETLGIQASTSEAPRT